MIVLESGDIFTIRMCPLTGSLSHYAQMDLNKKSGAMYQNLIAFNIDAQGLRKTKNENHPTQEIGVTS